MSHIDGNQTNEKLGRLFEQGHKKDSRLGKVCRKIDHSEVVITIDKKPRSMLNGRRTVLIAALFCSLAVPIALCDEAHDALGALCTTYSSLTNYVMEGQQSYTIP